MENINSTNSFKPLIAVIVPVYNEHKLIQNAFIKISDEIKKLVYKNLIHNKSYIGFVDDGSQDKSPEILKKLENKHKNLKTIFLPYNLGHQKALITGLQNFNYDIAVTLDLDLQDPPELIEKMIRKYLNGYSIVCGVRKIRIYDNFTNVFFSTFFYALSYIFVNRVFFHHADFRLLTKDSFNSLTSGIIGQNLCLRVLIDRKSPEVDYFFYKRKKRKIKKLKNQGYNFHKRIKLAIYSFFYKEKNVKKFYLIPILLITGGYIKLGLLSLINIFFGIYYYKNS
ncbi:MAG: glycosyltransferase [Candidatus Muiribacteriota bacterium]